MIRTLLLAALLTGTAWGDPCEAPLPKKGAVFAGAVTYIVDGDGFCVGEEDGGIEVRVADLYVVELREPGGREAKAIAERVLMGKNVVCVARGRNRDRSVAVCSIDGRLVADVLVEAGVKQGGRGR